MERSGFDLVSYRHTNEHDPGYGTADAVDAHLDAGSRALTAADGRCEPLALLGHVVALAGRVLPDPHDLT